MLQQNTITTVNTCCIIHGKVCCNANIATNDATAAFCCINSLQHESVLQRFNATVSCNTSAPLQHRRTVATICCNTGVPLQRFVATPAHCCNDLLQHRRTVAAICCNTSATVATRVYRCNQCRRNFLTVILYNVHRTGIYICTTTTTTIYGIPITIV